MRIRALAAFSLVTTSLSVTSPTAVAGVATEPPVIRAGTDGKSLPQEEMHEPAFTIAILPDRTSGRDWGLPYLERGVEEINIIQPDAVFNVGDMIQGYTRSIERYLEETADYHRIVGKLTAPFYSLPGNHDVISGMRDPSDRRFEDLYKEHYGPLYYAVEFEQATIIALYSDEALDSDPVFTDTQIAWLDGELQRADQRVESIIVMLHKPAWRYRRSNWDSIHALLARSVREHDQSVTVIAGHFHSLQRDRDRDGVQYQLIGTCGALIDQHPLSGQFQHLTFVKVFPDTNEVRVYHHPIGCTLPDDFVTSTDQSRSNRLKSWRDVCTIRSVLDQPLGQSVSGPVRVEVRNVIDRPITATAALVKSAPGPSIVEGYGFVSRTQMDIHNPFVTNVGTPFEQIGTVEPIEIAPDETRELTVMVRCNAQTEMLPPPQINVNATYVDDHGRTVPVFIRRRLPLRMQYEIDDSPNESMPISAWTFSVYDLREQDPRVTMIAHEGRFTCYINSFDNLACHEPVEDVTTRVVDPKADTVVLRFGSVSDATAKYLMVEPFGPETSPQAHWVTPYRNESASSGYRANATPDSPSDWEFKLESVANDADVIVERGPEGQGYLVRVSIPLARVGVPGETLPFNLYIADNDLTYHTQWRSWAPDTSVSESESTITLPD